MAFQEECDIFKYNDAPCVVMKTSKLDIQLTSDIAFTWKASGRELFVGDAWTTRQNKEQLDRE